MFQSKRARGLIALFCLAVALRLAFVLLIWDRAKPPYVYEHGLIAENLVRGNGFSIGFLGDTGPTSQQAPLYPFLLAGWYSLFGPGNPTALLAMQITQCIAGGLLTLAAAWLGFNLAPGRARVGWVSGLIACVFPTQVYMVSHIQVAPWATLHLALLMAVVTAAWGERTIKKGMLVGGLCGSIPLWDPILVLASVVAALTYAWRELCAHRKSADHPFTSTLIRCTVVGAMGIAMIAPWTVRNYLVHGEFVFVKSTFGYAFWQGNNEISWGTDKVPGHDRVPNINQQDGGWVGQHQQLLDARLNTRYIDELLLTSEDLRALHGLSEPAKCRELQRRADKFIRENPRRYAALCLQRLRFLLLWDETNPKSRHWFYKLTSCTWLLLSVTGLILIGRRIRPHVPLLALCMLITLFHVLTIVSARFRLPLEPLTFPWMAEALLAVSAGALAIGRRLALFATKSAQGVSTAG